jgi:LacI family transcriptional regulator
VTDPRAASASAGTATPAGTATLSDVAAHAGVSLATASRVLNGSERKVAESFRERVVASALTLGYTANLSAQATARGTSAVIALLVADIADPYFGEIASGVARGADEAGLVVTIAITQRDPAREVQLVRALRGQRPRGVILAASRDNRGAGTGADDTVAQLSGEFERIRAAGGQVVALGSGVPHARSVSIDNRGGARELGLALAARGYRSAVCLGAPAGVETSDDRLAGFAEGFIEGGGTQPRVHRGGFTREWGARMMAEALAEGVEPGTVVVAISDVIALGTLAVLREAGREIGSDVALAGFDDIPVGRDVSPALTTVRVPLVELGYRALRASLDTEWTSPPPPLPLEVLLRGSTPPHATPSN